MIFLYGQRLLKKCELLVSTNNLSIHSMNKQDCILIPTNAMRCIREDAGSYDGGSALSSVFVDLDPLSLSGECLITHDTHTV